MKVCFTSISIFVSDTRSLPIEGNFSQIFDFDFKPTEKFIMPIKVCM